MHLLALLFAGAFLSNALPHTLAGIQGLPFPTPFAKPHGVGDSSPLVNVLWGFLNVQVGLLLLASSPVVIGLNAGFGALFLGALLLAVMGATHFGKVQAAKARK